MGGEGRACERCGQTHAQVSGVEAAEKRERYIFLIQHQLSRLLSYGVSIS